MHKDPWSFGCQRSVGARKMCKILWPSKNVKKLLFILHILKLLPTNNIFETKVESWSWLNSIFLNKIWLPYTSMSSWNNEWFLWIKLISTSLYIIISMHIAYCTQSVASIHEFMLWIQTIQLDFISVNYFIQQLLPNQTEQLTQFQLHYLIYNIGSQN